jgi:superfamily II DNA or RNA helicase
MVKMKYRRVVERHHISLEIPHDETLLRTVVRDRWNPFKEKPAVNAAEACYIMRQVVNSHPGRLKVVDELVRRHKRIILFYNFNYELYRLRELGKKHNIGEYNGHKHQGIPQTSEWLYLVQYTSGAEAWNCIDTNVIVFFSLNYSYKTMIQASGRIDRMNSPFSELYYYYLVSNSTIDKSIMRTIKDKGIFNEREFLTKQGLVFSSQEKHML